MIAPIGGLAALILAACASSPPADPGPDTPQLAGSEWRPTEIGDTALPVDSGMFVRFGGDGGVEGHGGCNRFSGPYVIEGPRIEIGPLATTRMACPEPSMGHESQFLAALEGARGFERDGVDLSLTDGSGSVIGRLIQTDAD